MTHRILGRKLKMTQLYLEDGKVVPVTLINCDKCVVAKIIGNKAKEYSAIQLGLDEYKKPSKPLSGQYEELSFVPKVLREFPLQTDEKPAKVGTHVKASIFEDAKNVNIVSVSKGKGFAGVIKRHGFSRGPETHGSDHHRKPGSIGAMFPQRVLKGQKLPGHLGNKQVTLRNCQIVSIDKTSNLIAIKGAVPGSKNSIVTIVSNE